MNANQQSSPPGATATGAGVAVPLGTGDLMPNDKAMEHLWRFFALHAQQRVSVFNFFVVLAGVISAAIGGALQAGRPLSVVVIALGLLLPLLSFVFWRLDQRNSDLIKISERALRSAEMACLPDYARIFVREETAGTPTAHADDRVVQTSWTFRTSFRFIFVFMGVAGILASGLGAYRLFPEPTVQAQVSEKPGSTPQSASGAATQGKQQIGSTLPAAAPAQGIEASPTNVLAGTKGSAADPKAAPEAGAPPKK